MIFMTVFNNHFYAVFPLIFDGKMGSKITLWPTFDAPVVGFLIFGAVQKNMEFHDFSKLADVRFFGVPRVPQDGPLGFVPRSSKVTPNPGII